MIASARAGLRRLPVNLALAIVLAGCFVLPDHLMQLLGDQDRAIYSPSILAACLVLALVVASLRSIHLALILLGVFATCELLHFSYMAYFGGVINANVIMQLFEEYSDVAQAGIAVAPRLFFAPLMVIVSYGVAGGLLYRLRMRRMRVPLLSIALLALLATIPFRIITEDNPARYYPVDTYPSLANSYLTLSMLAVHHVPGALLDHLHDPADAGYIPVSIRETPIPQQATIVVFMSESMSARRLSLFGHARPTTPLLDSLRENPDFIYREGIATAVRTLSSFQSFWNGVRDPRHEQAFIDQTTNVFRLARLHGFRTTMISTQGSNLLRGAGTNFIDTLITQESIPALYEELFDEALVKLAADIPLGDRNLIVLHQRSAHGQYEKNYRLRPEFAIYPTQGVSYADYQRNAYDNAMRYNDMVIYQLLQLFRKRVTGPLYFFATSDHGELLGDTPTGQFGHGFLDPDIAQVPVLYFGQQADATITAAMRAVAHPTHYELVALVARVMGFEIIDPNATEGVYFINGTGNYGRHGYIIVEKTPGQPEEIKYQVVPVEQPDVE